MHVVVCGGGVIGAATAYFLTELGIEVTLVERCSLAAAASGKAGGFLARDWCDANAMGPLARASFDLHAELAERLGADYGYRRVDTLMVAGADEASVAAYARLPTSAWLDGNCAVNGRLGTPETTAQVEPGAFTRALVDAAGRNGGARVRIGAVEGLVAHGASGAVAGALVDGETIAADAVVLAMGPWTALARQWVALPPIGGLKGFSITLRPDFEVPAEMLFCEYRTARGEVLAPEIYPRPDGEVWVCGMSDDQPVPIDPAHVRVDDARCDELRRIAGTMATGLAEARITRRQACYRPICADAMPLLGPVPGRPGAFVATGHNCWGILNAPASGKAMAELIATGEARCVDLAPFDPGRLLEAA
ncbi:MAG: FAD-dependent oxidoreductase [Immundisolibacterales bacterium]|nr:FAD-dependent oxidoreductase [Immundisolibacterales bacterium]